MAITTPDAVPGEMIEAAWGDAVRADLQTLDAAIATKVAKAGDTMTGDLTAGAPATGEGYILRSFGQFVNHVRGPTHAALDANLGLARNISPAGDVGGRYVNFERGGTSIGSINIGTGGTQVVYLTTSDARLKDVRGALDDGLVVVLALRPVRFVWKGDETATEDVGFLAHEVAELIPHAVTGDADAVDDAGRIVPQQLDESALVPYLVAAVQSLAARVEALEAA